MLANIVAGLITAVLLALGGLLWRHRRHLGLLRAAVFPSGRLRVSVAALLRIKDDDGYVLFHHPIRPHTYGPPGGVVKYRGGARKALDAVGFVDQRRPAGRASAMSHDLRGFVPSRHGIGFLRWYGRGDDRESGSECLRRELREELAEVGHPALAPLTEHLRFELVRTVSEGPRPTPGKQYSTLRSFEVYDVVPDTPEATELVRRLVALGRDPAETQIVLVSASDIEEGRSGAHLISPQSAFLLGNRRIHQDLPALS
ncbi:SMODS-associated NUDIX domain-containing protein [Micromonospora sp. PTRAS2]